MAHANADTFYRYSVACIYTATSLSSFGTVCSYSMHVLNPASQFDLEGNIIGKVLSSHKHRFGY